MPKDNFKLLFINALSLFRW